MAAYSLATTIAAARSVIVAVTLALPLAPCAQAAPIRLDFEGLADGESIASFYDGGLGSAGSGPGRALGVRFVGGQASLDADAGGSGPFGGEPSASTAAAPEAFAIVLNTAAGFSGGIALHYTNPGGTLNVRIYPELDTRGAWLADLYFGSTPSGGAPDPTGSFGPFVAAGASFDGIARSVLIFSRGPGGFFIDDLVLGSSDPAAGAVPLPSTLPLLAGGALLLLARRGRPGAWSRVSLRAPRAPRLSPQVPQNVL